jgi:hypothetical protein
MSFRVSSALCAVFLLLSGFCQSPSLRAQTSQATPTAAKSILIAGNLGDNELLRLSAGSGDSVLLLDRPYLAEANLRFLQAFAPEQVMVAGIPESRVQEIVQRSGLKMRVSEYKNQHSPSGKPATVLVVCPAEPRGTLLQATCLAASLNAELRICDEEGAEVAADPIVEGYEKVYAIGKAVPACRKHWPKVVTPLTDNKAVMRTYVQALRTSGPVRNLVVANPEDIKPGKGRLSTLAPWVAMQKHAVLVLTNEEGSNVAEAVEAATRLPGLGQIDTLIIVANLRAIPMEKRPNPAPGKDTEISLEPLTPTGSALFSYAIGRLFHEEPGMIPLILARERLLPPNPTSRKVLLVSNPGGGLSLLESISRNTAKEFLNRGYDEVSLFNENVQAENVRSLMPQQDIFLWEGHYRTMVDRFGMPKWNEPLLPSLVFLQSCLALNESDTRPLFDRGAIALIGSPTRTYSGSGGAFTMSFFDALLYEDRTLGGALRQSKNFQMAYALLKEKRLGKSAKLAGANRRSAWAFTLWGDPTLRLPQPPLPADTLPRVRCTVKGDSLTLNIPQETYPKVHSGDFQAEILPNARLAGLVSKTKVDKERRLVPMLYAEVALPKAPAGKTPKLTSKLPDNNWVFAWDARRHTGYLLALPRSHDRQHIRFQVEWEDTSISLNWETISAMSGSLLF